jgi:L-gulonolactone oxidase
MTKAAAPAPKASSSSNKSNSPKPAAASKPASTPPPDNNNNVITAAYGYVQCRPDVVLRPTSTSEVADSLKRYHDQSERDGTVVKVRATRDKFHSSASFPCPEPSTEERASGKPLLTVTVLNDGLNKVLKVDKQANTMRVGAGMDLNELTYHATQQGMSVRVGALPYYAGLTLSGVLLTSAHGSGDRTWSKLADTVLEITWVDGTGQTRVTKRDSDEGRALVASVGNLGVVTELLLQLTPPTYTHLMTRYEATDADMVNDFEKLLTLSPHILIFWRPDFNSYSAYLSNPVDVESVKKRLPATLNLPPVSDARMTLLPSYASYVPASQLMRDWDTTFPDIPSGLLMCPIARSASVGKTWANANNGTGKSVLTALAPSNQMQASECDNDCAFNGPQFNSTAEDVEFTIDWDRFADWVSDVKKLVQTDVQAMGQMPLARRCIGLGYIWLRVGKGDQDLLSTSYGLERPVYLQSTWLRSRMAPGFPNRRGFALDVIEQMTLCKYQGRPHWGKNFWRTYTHPTCHVRDRYPKFDEAMAAAAKYDPKRMFESKLMKEVRDKGKAEYFPGCDPVKRCYCQEDVHCTPGFACVPAEAFPEYKVCKNKQDLAIFERAVAARRAEKKEEKKAAGGGSKPATAATMVAKEATLDD